MKRIFIVFACVVTIVAFFSSVWAINRAPKSEDSKDKEEPTELKEIEKKTPKKQSGFINTLPETNTKGIENKQRVPSQTSEETKKRFEEQKAKGKYDYFIDKNNNGIDDRLEGEAKPKEIKKREDPQKEAPAFIERIPPKVSPPPFKPEKEKDENSSEKRKETKGKKTETVRERDKK